MPALNYTVFTDKVASGEKLQTIRADRKRPFRVGDTLMHYTGMRTKKCRKLRSDTVCVSAEKILIEHLDPDYHRVSVGGKRLNTGEIVDLIIADGFSDIELFFYFFKTNHGFPFTGQVVKWEK